MTGQISRYLPISPRDRRWGFHVTGVGHALVKPTEDYPPEPHPPGYNFGWEQGRRLEEFALVYLVEGRGIFESEHQSRAAVRAGHAWFLFPGEWHRYRPDTTVGWEEYWVTFGGAAVERWRREGFLNLHRPVVAGLGLSLAPTFEELLRLVPCRRPDASFVVTGLCHLLVGRALAAVHAATARERAGQRILEAADYMRLHAGEEIDLSGLARRFAMSYSGFRRAFARHLGVPPHRFHRQARVALVKEMLAETGLPLKEIAARTGYPSEFYLMQAFKRQTGLTPTQWRKTGRSIPRQADHR